VGADVGLGGDELDGNQGGGRGRVPDGPFPGRLVVGLRARCRSRGPRRDRLQVGHVPWSIKYVYEKGGGHTTKDKIGEVLYNRGVINALYDTEALRTAQGKYGKKPLTGEQIRWGFENLDLSDARIKELGAEGLATPVKLSCEDHEGGGKVRIQQWDGQHWKFITDWITPDRTLIREMYKEGALAYAKEKGITPRDCSKEVAAQ